MRILAVTLQNYRVHQKLALTFHRERTVIGGPNESGKSTLIEAIHRALFLRARTTGTAWDAMKSILGGGHPEISVTLEIAGKPVQVSKRFSGSSGTTSLVIAANPALHGDPAEEEISRLLRVSPAASAKAASEHWAHLWVWQGQSSDDPASHANRQRDSLIQRLGENNGVVAVAQSAADSKLANFFAAEVARTFKSGDKAKVDSPLAKAEADVESATRVFDEAQARLTKLSQAREAYLRASSELDSLQNEFARLAVEQEQADARVLKLSELRRLEALRKGELDAADATEKDHQRIAQLVDQTRENLHRLQRDLGPAEAALGQLDLARGARRAEADAALRESEHAAQGVAHARDLHELTRLEFSLFAQQQRRDELRAAMVQVVALDKSISEYTAELAQLPPIDAAQLKALESAERDFALAEAALRALAASIELLAGNQSVRIGQRELAVGSVETVTQAEEITIGPDVRLRIRPGGGTTLADAQRAAQDARSRRAREQSKSNATTAAQAREWFEQRKALSDRIEKAQTRRQDLVTSVTPAKLATSEDDVLATEAAIVRRRAAAADHAPAAALTENAARQENKVAAEQLTIAEDAEKRARAGRDLAVAKAEQAQQAFAQHENVLRQQKSGRDMAQGQLNLLTQTHGDDATRWARLTEAVKLKNAAESALNETRAAIAAEQPDLVEANQKRLQRAISETRNRRGDAEKNKAIAEHELRTDGSIDPENDLALASAKKESASSALESTRRHAHALRLLDQLFREEQQTLATTFTRPLIEKAGHYLRTIYGPETQLSIAFADGEFSDLRLSRPRVGGGAAIAFQQLSGGTKEQVAVAMRLAMAEILAMEHGGTLPLILDDAFVNADPERLSLLQIMLDTAAARGLQVIVVTCTPADYSSLGATHLSIATAAQSAGRS